MPSSFPEIWARIPPTKRSNTAKILTALFVMEARDTFRAVSASKIAAFLKLKLRGKAPTNTADALRKATPGAEPHETASGRLAWSITTRGVEYLEGLSGLLLVDLAVPSGSYGIASLHPVVRQVAEPLLHDGHFTEAVGRAVKELNFSVHQRTG